VNDRVVWSVGLCVGLSPSKPCIKFGSDRDTICVQDSGGPGKHLSHIADRFEANTVLCSFNTIQPSSCFWDCKMMIVDEPDV